MSSVVARALLAGALGALLVGCESGEAAPAAPKAPPRGESVEVRIAGQRFHLEVAADGATRYRGLGGRDHIPTNSGMLFVFPDSAPRTFVMRDCRIPIDVAFVDDRGRVVAIHAMAAEPPRRPGESMWEYEGRLPGYPSGAPARFAVEAAGGRLAEVGLGVGDRILFDHEAFARLAR